MLEDAHDAGDLLLQSNNTPINVTYELSVLERSSLIGSPMVSYLTMATMLG